MGNKQEGCKCWGIFIVKIPSLQKRTRVIKKASLRNPMGMGPDWVLFPKVANHPMAKKGKNQLARLIAVDLWQAQAVNLKKQLVV